MSKIKSFLKAGITTSLIGLGLYTLDKKCGLLCKASGMIQDMELRPFPGTRLYTFITSKQFNRLYSEIASEMNEFPNLHNIIDINTGTGLLPIELSVLNNELSIYGIDKSGEMIQIANANSRAKGTFDSVNFYTGDYNNIPFPGMYFDMAIMISLFGKWKDPVKTLESVYHIIKPGSEFHIYGYRKDIDQNEWKNLRDKVPSMYRPLFMMGPASSYRLTFSEQELLGFVEKTNFIDPVIEKKTYTIFDIPMSIFYMMKIKKPD